MSAIQQLLASYGGAGSNSLKTNLISYWKFDEASGNATDAHGSNTLTDNGSVGSAGGLINNSRNFNGSSQYFEIADNDSLSTGDIDFTWQMWVKVGSLSGVLPVFQKASGSGLEYDLYLNISGFPRFRVSANSSGFGGMTSITSAHAITTGAWVRVLAMHDSVNNLLGIQIDNNSMETASYSDGVADTTNDLRFGADWFGEFSNLSIDETAFWKRTLTSDERTLLYNSGAGYAYSDFQ